MAPISNCHCNGFAPTHKSFHGNSFEFPLNTKCYSMHWYIQRGVDRKEENISSGGVVTSLKKLTVNKIL